jgi:hypothetical protein
MDDRVTRSQAIKEGIRKAKMSRAAVAEVNTLFKMFDIKAKASYGPYIYDTADCKKFPFRIIRWMQSPYSRIFFSQADQMREYANIIISERVEQNG